MKIPISNQSMAVAGVTRNKGGCSEVALHWLAWGDAQRDGGAGAYVVREVEAMRLRAELRANCKFTDSSSGTFRLLTLWEDVTCTKAGLLDTGVAPAAASGRATAVPPLWSLPPTRASRAVRDRSTEVTCGARGGPGSRV